MKYMVLETHLGYAVVLSEDGQFRKVANKNYEVGQLIDYVFEMNEPQAHFFSANKIMAAISVLSAVAVILVTLVIRTPTPASSFASVFLKINPEVRIDVNQEKVVEEIEGLNQEGQSLASDYDYKQKHLDIVIDELVDLSLQQDYLQEGGQISISFDAQDEAWIHEATTSMKEHVQEVLHNRVSATIIVGDRLTNRHEIVIPVELEDDNQYGDDLDEEPEPQQQDPTPSRPEPAPAPAPAPTPTPTPAPTTPPSYDDSDYDDSDYGDTDYDD